MELFSIKKAFGYGIFVGLEANQVSSRVIDSLSTGEYEREVWLFGRIHIVISNLKGYQHG